MFSASSSGISTSNSSSIAITSSTMSRLSAPRSSMKEDSGLISSSPTPSWSAMMDLTLASMADVDIELCSLVFLRNCPSPGASEWRAVYPTPFVSPTDKLHVHPAVHLEDLAGDVRGGVAREEQHCIRHVLGAAEPRQRDGVHH